MCVGSPCLQNVEFWAINTDKQALDSNICPNKLQIGIQLTRGLGTGGKPTLGEQAAQESVEELGKVVAGADMLFITAGELTGVLDMMLCSNTCICCLRPHSSALLHGSSRADVSRRDSWVVCQQRSKWHQEMHKQAEVQLLVSCGLAMCRQANW